MARECIIVGAGTVGRELARQLSRSSGLQLTLTARSAESVAALEAEGFSAETLDLRDTEAVTRRVHGIAHIVFTAAPSGGSERAEVYDAGLRALAAGTTDGAHLVMSSSTGVYAEDEGAWVDEASPLDDGGRAASLRAGEQVTGDRDGCVLRFSGLISPERGPQRAVDRLSGTEQEDRWLNLVYVKDAARALRWAVENGPRGIFNVSGPPVSRREFYAPLFRAAGREEPQWSNFTGRGYRVDSGAYFEASGHRPAEIDVEALAASAFPGGQGGASQGHG